MEQYILLGMDESNHGLVPEILVGYPSNNRADITETGPFGKRSIKSIDTIENIIASEQYRHVVISVARDKEHRAHLLLAGFAQIIDYYRDILETVLIDGAMEKSRLDAIFCTVNIPNLDLVAEPKGDTRFKIVNVADHLANILWKYYRENPAGKTYSNTLLTTSDTIYRSIKENLCIN